MKLIRDTQPLWLALVLTLPALLLLTGCGPRVVSAPPSPSVKPVMPDSLKTCPQPLSWMRQTCAAAATGKPTE